MKTTLHLTVSTLLLAVSELSAATLYVSLESTNPTPPYADWATAATDIQWAVNAAGAGDVVIVTNGLYAGGVSVTKPLTLLSVNGPQLTLIDGGGTNRCISLADGASLTGFTLRNGWTDQGGGAFCAYPNAFITNCVIVGNSAYNSGGGAVKCTLYNCTLSANFAELGGGAAGSTLYNCTLTGNLAEGIGGGVEGCTAYNCTLTGNSARESGGGAEASRLNNCILYFNTAPVGENHDIEGSSIYGYSAFNYCSTTPMPTNGVGNITNAPLFVDDTSGNVRLQSDSPCINSGNNAYVTTTTDLDGNRRIVSGTVDIGAYEYQGTGSVISYAWLQQYGLPTDGSADYGDLDHDSMNNWQEWVAGTISTNPASVLRLGSPAAGAGGVTLTWASVTDRTYSVERATNMTGQPAFSILQSNLAGLAGATSYTDTNPPTAGPAY